MFLDGVVDEAVVDTNEAQERQRNACQVPLPSADSANRVLDGDTSSIPRAVLHTAGRAALIGVGMWTFGHFKPRDAAVGGISGAVAIEGFALLYLSYKRSQQKET
jgi:hypothetical protein